MMKHCCISRSQSVAFIWKNLTITYIHRAPNKIDKDKKRKREREKERWTINRYLQKPKMIINSFYVLLSLLLYRCFWSQELLSLSHFYHYQIRMLSARLNVINIRDTHTT